MQSIQNIQRRTSKGLAQNQVIAEQLGTSIETIHSYLDQRGVLNFMHAIHDAGERAATIVTNMLQFSRQSNKSLQDTDLSELLDRTLTIADSDFNLAKGYDFKRIRIIKDHDTSCQHQGRHLDPQPGAQVSGNGIEDEPTDVR